MKKNIFLVIFLIIIISAGLFLGVKTKNTKTLTYEEAQSIPLSDDIHINQLGYKPNGNKTFILCGEQKEFSIVDSKTNQIAMEGTTSEPKDDHASGNTVCIGNFSDLEEEGTYYIYISDIGKSYEFDISNDVYTDIKNSLQKMLYYQRSNLDLTSEFAGEWSRKANKNTTGKVCGDEDTVLESIGGWFDAGDYGRYSVPGAKALADLLLAYELFPDSFSDNTNIPESKNGVPDVLDESRYELEWLLSMQDSSTGGVYHKLTTKNFTTLTTSPENIFGDFYFSPISSTATGSFAAIMAKSARIFKQYDLDFSNKCMQAAEKAWDWLELNKDYPMFENPTIIKTGDYTDTSDSDERYWASIELYRLTGKDKYHEYIKEQYNNLFGADLYWTDTSETYNVAFYGTASYLFMNEQSIDQEIRNSMKANLISQADNLLATCKEEGYNVCINKDQYSWGSNMNVMHGAINLIVANMLKPNEEYINYAQEQFNYLLGKNPLGISYVTGYGQKRVMNPHHRISIADSVADPVPGMVIGGPNSNYEDTITKSKLDNEPPAKCFLDNALSFSSNEVTIYWNSAALFVASYLDYQ